MIKTLLLKSGISRENEHCEPPNTVLAKELGEPIVVGCGGVVVDTLLPEIILGATPVRIALLQLGYLMYRAKKNQIFCKGAETDATVITSSGILRQLTWDETSKAEEIGPYVDGMLRNCYIGAFSRPPEVERKKFWQGFSKYYDEVTKKADTVHFTSLAGLFDDI